ncbi:MAG: iron chelate uptake ABC transporter family permease subunit [Beutenbergiaceae bacterium]
MVESLAAPVTAPEQAPADLTRAPGIAPGGRPGEGRSAKRRTGNRRVWLVIAGLSLLAVLIAVAMLTWDNPMPVGSEGFWRIVDMRTTNLLVLAVVAFAQAMATVAFQTVTNNRILTPSIMGFESLYTTIQTSAVYFLGITGVVVLQGVPQFALMIVLMVGFSLLLYGWLLSGKYANMQVMLLVGIVIGGGLGSISMFMRRLLTPSEFDVLAARLFGNIANADADYLPLAIPLVVVAGTLLWSRSRRLNVLALGRDASTNLGLNHRREVIYVLTLVSILMAVSTSLVGILTFFGFLAATLAYQLADTYDHRAVFPIAALTGFVVLGGAYFVVKNLFYAQGVVSIVIEVVGGSLFLVMLLRKGRL